MSEGRASRLLRFIQFPTFLRDWARLGLGDEALQEMERQLIASPNAGDVIEQTGGLRKLRFAPAGSGRGKRGSIRVCYAHYPAFGTIALFLAFGKNERSDLSPADLKAIRKALAAFGAELRGGTGRRDEGTSR